MNFLELITGIVVVVTSYSRAKNRKIDNDTFTAVGEMCVLVLACRVIMKRIANGVKRDIYIGRLRTYALREEIYSYSCYCSLRRT